MATFNLAAAFPGGMTARGDVVLHVQATDDIGLELDADPRTVTEWDTPTKAFVGRDGGHDVQHTDLHIDTVAPTLRRRP